MSRPENEYDLVIAGGGLAGACLAVALADTLLRIAIVEAVPYGEPGQPSYDDRSIALAYGSRRILDAMGLWRGLSERVSPIRRIHVTDRGHPGALRMDAAERRLDALGYVVENRDLGAVLFERLSACPRIDVLAPARLLDTRPDSQGRLVEIGVPDGIRYLRCRLIVGADGGRSRVRELAGIEVDEHDYGQSALIANISCQRPHEGTAHERFTPDGPLAMLPMTSGRCSLVWTRRPEEAEALRALDEAAFLEALQKAFGRRLGRLLRVGSRHVYPLSLIVARELTAERLALIGNAAHSLHPVAGQGFNLGLRDIAVLAECLASAAREGRDPGAPGVLEDYARWRHDDLRRAVRLTDGLIALFANENPLLVALRNAGLVAMDLTPCLKGAFVRQMAGMAGRLPRLARGLPV